MDSKSIFNNGDVVLVISAGAWRITPQLAKINHISFKFIPGPADRRRINVTTLETTESWWVAEEDVVKLSDLSKLDRAYYGL